MAVASIKTKEPVERGNISRTIPSLPPVDEQHDLTYVIALAEATRERKLAASRISELARQTVDKLINLAERTMYS